MLIFKRPGLISISLLLVSMVFSGTGTVLADERILDYQSDILIHTDGDLIVTETIQVNAEGENIRRGSFGTFQPATRTGATITITLS